jgi:conjugative relaxase-like TrwC/TraI family protein
MIMVLVRFAHGQNPPLRGGKAVAEVTVATGYDVDYYLDQVGVDYYLTAAGEPPGIWAGKGAEALGLSGPVGHDKASAEVMRNLFHYGIAPDGTLLGSRQKAAKYQARAAYAMVEEAIARRIAALGRFATPEEKRDIRLQERSRMRARTPYYDMTFSAEKSVTLAGAGRKAAAKRARDEGRGQGAEQHEAMAERIEAAVMAGADEMLRVAEQRGAIVRTGHHSATSGEYRDAAGFTAVKFPQHTSRAGDPQLHVQAVILNKAQRADGADDKYRALDGRQLWRERLGIAAHAGAREAQELARLRLPLVKREDGNGFEIGGIDQATLRTYSGRAAQIEAELADLLIEYKEIYGRAPDRATLYKLRKQVTLSTRAAKRKPKQDGADTPDDRAARAEAELVAWMRKAQDAQVQALEDLHEAIEAYALEHPEALPEQLPGEEERNRSIRKAIAEVQRQNSTWTRAQLEWEIYRQMPVLPASADWCAYLDAMAGDALAGRVPGTDVMRIAPIPDMVDVSSLDHRKDGASVYRPPGEERFACASHVDTEGWILSKAIEAAVPQLVTEAQADAALAGTDLGYEQRRVVKGMLTSGRFINCLVAPAGTGKTHVLAAFAKAWAQITGGRVIGLTLSENAARVMAAEGLEEAWNITRFFANRVPVGPADRLVIDEASQVSTVDWARISSLALQAGGRVDGVGDTRQLGAVEAGGMFPLIAGRAGNWKLGNVQRFAEAWEREASLRLRDGDVMALAAYQAHGRVYEGPQDRVHDQAVDLYMLDVGQGKTSLLLAGSNEEAATLARLVRERRIDRGQISAQHEVTLRDGNHAGVGDIVRARLNTEIDAGGRRLTNRDTLRLAGFRGRGTGRYAIAERQTGPGAWSAPFDLPVAYLEENTELGYAGNVYVAQGATVDRARLVVSPGMSRDMFYVGMSRAREENTAHVVTGPADPAGLSRAEREAFARKGMAQAAELLARGDAEAARAVPLMPPEPEGMRDRAPWESVLAEIMHNDDPATSALEQIKQAQESVMNTRHLLELSEAFWWKDVVPQIDEAVRQRIGPREYERYLKDPERPAFLQELRAHEIGGRRIGDSLDAITDRSFDGAHSIAAVLHGRLGKAQPPGRGQTAVWADRSPELAPDQIRETQRMLDLRQAELGRRLAAQPPQWALERWGDPRGKSPARLADWQRRAAIVESYREAAGITDPRQAIGPVPANQAQLREAFHASVLALELPDNEALIRAMSQGRLEATVDAYDQALAVAPASVEHELAELGRQHQAHAAQAQAAREAGDTAAAQSASILAEMDGAEVAKLRVADAARAEWTEAHAPQAAEARRAEQELQRRGLAARLSERIPVTDAELAEASQQPRETPPMTPERARELREAQTAELKAQQEAEAEKMARLIPVTDAEIAKYGAGAAQARAEAEAEPQQADIDTGGTNISAEAETEPADRDRGEARAGLREEIQALSAKVDEMSRQDAERAAGRAQIVQAAIDEPAVREPQPEPDLEAAWQPGSAQGQHEADAEPEMEIG